MRGDAERMRPEPEALLPAAELETRGRLKVYLGMAPGVGKTFAMLEGARRLRAAGVDVVVGVVETHGRVETETLLAGLELLPRRLVDYRGKRLAELDLDGALARRPRLLLVDELAHGNPPGSRHVKRWQDVQELLAAGIDVHTTLNVQHLEGLNDVVARITGVTVRETLPDHVLEEAAEVELVDLPPEELLERLRDGKVYAPHLAGRAREGFFKPGNLTALRELALRRTAERVDDQLVAYMRRQAIAGPWPTGARVLVAVAADDSAPALVQAARRLATLRRARWVAVHVERHVGSHAEEENAAVAQALASAERLGGRSERLAGRDVPGELLRYARRNNVTTIVVGASRPSRLWALLGRSLVPELVRRGGGIEVHVVTPERPPPRRRRFAWPALAGRGVVGAAGGVATVVALAKLVPELSTQANAAMLLLAAVVASALAYGLGIALVAAVLAFLCLNFFFTEPHWTFEVAHWHDLLALVVFLVVAASTGSLAGRVRDQARAARSRVAALESLSSFARRLSASKTTDELLHAVVLQCQRLTGRPAIALLPGDDDLEVRYAWPPGEELAEAALAAARWAWRHAEPAGSGTDTLPAAGWHFRPLRSGEAAVGVLGLGGGGWVQAPELQRTLDALLDQAAVAIERIGFAAEAANVVALAETARFRTALLSSISHDLRTPLTSILGSVTALRRDPERYSAADREELLATIEEEAERLDRFVANLLDVTRLEAGALEVRREWLVVAEVVESACRRSARQLSGKRLKRHVGSDLPLLKADFVLLETVLVNLLENAGKHAEGATTVEVAARELAGELAIEITDDGTGIPADHQLHLFDKFYRIGKQDQTAAGTGLGLSIARGLAEALGGRLELMSPVAEGRGTRFTLTFPLVEREAQPLEEEPR